MLVFFRILRSLGLLVVIVACMSIAFSLPAKIDPEEGIDMVQPGKRAETSLINSQVNVNNSQANLNNSEARLNDARATAVITDMQGNYEVSNAQAEKLKAEACAVRNDCHGPAGTIAAKPGDLLIVIIAGVCIVLLLIWLAKAVVGK